MGIKGDVSLDEKLPKSLRVAITALSLKLSDNSIVVGVAAQRIEQQSDLPGDGNKELANIVREYKR